MPSDPKTKKKTISASAVFNNNCSKINGHCLLSEERDSNGRFIRTKIQINITGLTPGKHGFHIHESGNLLEGCKSCCSHFNPYGVKHGGINDLLTRRHLGDLGNIEANSQGVVDTIIYDRFIRLSGTTRNIIGRSVVVHQDEDDLGQGGDVESSKTGNAGARIGCAVIGLV